MPILELGIDARKMQTGAREAERALQGVSGAANRAAVTVTQSGTALNSAFATTGGAISGARGVAATASAFRSLNVESAAFSGAQALLDIGRMKSDFIGLSGAVTGTGGAFAKVGHIIRLNPLLFVATAITGIAVAFSFLRGEADKSAKALTGVVEKFRNIESVRAGANLLRLPGRAESEARSRQQALIEVANNRSSDPTSLRDVASQLGITEQQALQFFAQQEDFTQFGGQNLAGALLSAPDQRLFGLPASGIQIPPSQYDRLLQREFARQQSLEATARPGGLPNRSPYYLRGSEDTQERSLFGSLGPDGQRFDVRDSGAYYTDIQRRQAELDRADRVANEAQKRMDELVQSGREFGATIGDAFFNVASGAQSARQAIAQLVSQLARAASTKAFSNLFGQLGGVVGATTAQNVESTPKPRTPGQD